MAAAEVSRSVTSLGGLPTGGGAGGGAAPGPGGVKQNLPVIEHPMAKLDRDNLSVRGLGPPPPKPPTRQRTFVTIDRGEVKLGLDRANLPPLGAAAKDWTGRSLSQEVDTLQALVGGRYMPSRIVTPPGELFFHEVMMYVNPLHPLLIRKLKVQDHVASERNCKVMLLKT